jgi:hypothetical protein
MTDELSTGPSGMSISESRPDGRRVVVIRPNEHDVIAEIVEALADADPGLYQRGGELVRTVRHVRPESESGAGSPGSRIAPVPRSDLRTRITRAVQLKQVTKDRLEPIHPPGWVASGVAAVAAWPRIRPLEGISATPILRIDGTILQTPGYDPATGVLYEPQSAYPSIPDVITQSHAAAAAAELCEVVCDFPFAAPEHRAAWVAGALTPFARFAHRGPAPLFLGDANIRGAGKTLMPDVAANIAAEGDFARRSYPTGRDRSNEMRKVITALAIAGERLVLLDNLGGSLGDSSLDAALTGTEWSDRLLGHSKNIRAPLLITWWATGNNVAVEGDTSRRVLPIRLLSRDEHPEQREGFRHPELPVWVRQERGRLVKAALTILAGYIRAGRPDQHLRPWGSFEGWSGLVRAAVVWAGLPDPRAACSEFISQADTEVTALRAMLATWGEVDPAGEGLTAGKLLRALKDRPNEFPRFREALAEFCPARAELPDAHTLGVRLRKFVRRNVGGRWFENRPGHGGIAVWFVAEATIPGPAVRGDGGDGGDSAFAPTCDAHTLAPVEAGRSNPTNATIPTDAAPEPEANGHGHDSEPRADRRVFSDAPGAAWPVRAEVLIPIARPDRLG